MHLRLSEDAFGRSRDVLLSPKGDGLVQMMRDISLGIAAKDSQVALLVEAKALGWLTEAGTPTPLGYCAADSCREYSFWLDRDKALPFEPAADHLTPQYFTDKAALEIGSGAGFNLLSIQQGAASITGIEPVEVYTQMGQIFCEKEGVAPPEVFASSAEHMACPDAQFDVALCVAALHYFDVLPALRETARVLKPGGELLVIGWTFRDFFKSFRPNKFNTIALANTLCYMALRKRVVPNQASNATSRPIFPSIASVSRCMRLAGFEPLTPVRTGNDWCLRGQKPG